MQAQTQHILKDLNLFSLSKKEVIINSEEEDEGEEESGGREEMPHIMVVKEIQYIAEFIPVPENNEIETTMNNQ